MGISKEMLKELLYCLAIDPDLTPVKKEAEKVLYELFFADSASVHPSPAPPCQQQSPSNGLAHNNHTEGSQASQAQDHNAGIYGVQYMELTASESNNSAESFLNSLTFEKEDDREIDSFLYIRPPSAALKRQFPRGSKKVPHQNTVEETPKKDGGSLPQTSMDSEIVDCFSVDVTDLTCPHCMRLLFDPIVTSCGHTVCLRCLLCYLDEVPCCPLCREPVADLLESRKFIKTRLTEELLHRYLPDAWSDRTRIHEEELAALPNVTRKVPIFLGTIAFPSIIRPIYVSEFEYHVLIKKCREVGATRFAMCSPLENPGVGACGTLLEIKERRIVADGNPVVDTIGILRFRVLGHRHKNGLNTADLEHLEDKKVEGPEYAELVALNDAVYQQSVSWFAAQDDETKEEIINYFGSMPDKEPEPQSNPCGPAWAWWVLQVLPVEQKTQQLILCMTSLKDRLLALQSALVVCEETRLEELGKIS
ncbi:LON peptidase N-terminal domain and RING finger protein 2 [Echinops telfairi]|uniref:LON peptidase N-terminal domain and RING finger protein 2 n=1 Tax=Echinops telfairi TaxID=9371 RepID=A0AC55CNR4_ECHTE|nr:LON peptidase N-terminal domain and RING finger protein 2 [Echinops telfairi]